MEKSDEWTSKRTLDDVVVYSSALSKSSKGHVQIQSPILSNTVRASVISIMTFVNALTSY